MVSAFLVGVGLLAVIPSEEGQRADLAAYEAAREGVGRDPKAHVKLAMWCEARGLSAERLKHLALAVLLDPRDATARGLLGLVAFGGGWRSPDEVGAAIRADEDQARRLAEYNARRARLAETADAHWELARWCEQNGLAPEAQAHFTAVTRLDPARDAAWKRLGCKKVGGRWVTEARLAAEKTEAEARKQGERHWKPLLTKWRNWLDSKDRRAEAEHALADVTDPYAVASVWEVFGRQGAEHQLRAIQVLGQIDAVDSSRALALLAAWGRSDAVRQVASEVLRRRDPREYAGILLSLLRKPARYQAGITLGPDGFYHRVLHVEGKKADTEVTYGAKIGAPGKPLGYLYLPSRPFDPYGPLTGPMLSSIATAQLIGGYAAGYGTLGPTYLSPGSFTAADLWVAKAKNNERAWERQAAWIMSQQRPADSWRFQAAVESLESANAAILASNSAIYAALNRITGQDLPQDPEPWRTWYADALGYAYTSPQPVEKPRLTYFLSMPSCFAAGTLVKTIDGPRPIETVRVGDQVLAQDTRTGALNFRAVTAVHHNPPGETLAVRVRDETIVPSVFHRFWRAGQGWAMARDLKPGDAIRTYDGRERVTSVESAGVQPVFNLDVAADHTFFVGQGALLVHDNTLPEVRLEPFDAPRVTAATSTSAD